MTEKDCLALLSAIGASVDQYAAAGAYYKSLQTATETELAEKAMTKTAAMIPQESEDTVPAGGVSELAEIVKQMAEVQKNQAETLNQTLKALQSANNQRGFWEAPAEKTVEEQTRETIMTILRPINTTGQL